MNIKKDKMLLDKWSKNCITFTEIYCGHYITSWLFYSNNCKKLMEKYEIDIEKYIQNSDSFYTDKTKEIFNILNNIDTLLKNRKLNTFSKYNKDVFEKGYSKFKMVFGTLKLSDTDNFLFMLELRQIFKINIWEKIFPLLNKNQKKKINQFLNSLFIKIKTIFTLLRDSFLNIELTRNELNFCSADKSMLNIVYTITNLIKNNYNIDELYPKYNNSFMAVTEFFNIDFNLRKED